MLKFAKLFFILLRYRVALLLILFYFIGIAAHQQATHFSIRYLLGALSLLCSYVAATSVNDIIDKKIDQVNHPDSPGRPLVRGIATEKDVWMVNFLGSIGALALSLVAGLQPLLVMIISLAIGYIYSLPPLKLSHRTLFAYPLLAVAYSTVPYALGMAVSHASLGPIDSILLPGLFLLSLGRILLKDFRDRKGDAMYHKPTFLLKFGKKATCVVSTTAIISSNVLLLTALPVKSWVLGVLLQAHFVAVYIMAYKLYKAPEGIREQVAIGTGAKMGNGAMMALLGILVLYEYGADTATVIIFTAFLTAFFMMSFFVLYRNPEEAINAYRG